MIDYIKGKLVESSPLKATIEVNGIGYGLFIPLNNYTKLPQIGNEILLYVSTVIREDSHRSFGFLTKRERELFETLIEVSGIGPKTGLMLVGNMEISDLQLAISQSNISLLCKIPGIGKKTAERLVIELRDKCKKIEVESSFEALSSAHPTSKDKISDAISALINLGYHPQQAQKAVKTAMQETEDHSDLGKLITLALRKM